ncbi:MAG: hypothetical protein AAF242_02260 [Bacteroidota bacterium]
MDTRLASFKTDIKQYYQGLSEQEWDSFAESLIPVSYKKESIIFPIDKVCKQLLYISEGVVASQFQEDSKQVISRFFKSQSLASNIVSLLSKQTYYDQLIAITAVKGLLIPEQVFMDHYLHAHGIGLYFRKKLLNNTIEAKHFISIKTIAEVKYQLKFLQEYYPEILLEVPWKHIADFMGVTPAWLSRTLKKKDIRNKLLDKD